MVRSHDHHSPMPHGLKKHPTKYDKDTSLIQVLEQGPKELPIPPPVLLEHCCQGTKPPCGPTSTSSAIATQSGCNHDSGQAGDPQPNASQYADSERCLGYQKR